MTEKRKSPTLRFRGYSDDWEQRKLGDLCDITTGKLDANAMVQDGIYDFYTSGIEVYTIDKAAFEGPALTIAGNGASVGYIHLADGKFNAYQRTYVLTNFSADRQFLNVAIGNELPSKIQEEVRGSGIPYIVLNMLTELNIPFPSDCEQEKIGQYFSQLDHLITLHQRKLEKLKLVKKSMLEKMFPKNGSSVPEIRFNGFTDDWEQRKLGEVVERIVRKNENLESTLPLTISAQYGLIDQNEFFDKRIASKDVSGYYLVRKGEFAYNKSTSSDAPWGAVKRLDRYESGVLSTLYIVFEIIDETETCSDYLVTYYSTDLWHKGVQTIAAEGARNHGLLNIAPIDFFETELMLPSNIVEQRKIGAYFKQLDHLITLHQRKVEKLNILKKSMLEKMFV